MRRLARHTFALALAIAALGLPASAANAHVTRTVGPYTVTIGWIDEPPFAGVKNAVEIGVTDSAGHPVDDLGISPEVQVTFGDAQTTIPLEPSEEPGVFQAPLIPTRPGTYAFQLSASVDGRDISTGATCSERTFECVTPASDAEFPVADPPVGEVAERVAGTLPAANQASDDAKKARALAIAALAIAAVALVSSLAIVRRARRRSE
jgi:hypothetical protein